jgi:hypothetical protein
MSAFPARFIRTAHIALSHLRLLRKLKRLLPPTMEVISMARRSKWNSRKIAIRREMCGDHRATADTAMSRQCGRATIGTASTLTIIRIIHLGRDIVTVTVMMKIQEGVDTATDHTEGSRHVGTVNGTEDVIEKGIGIETGIGIGIGTDATRGEDHGAHRRTEDRGRPALTKQKNMLP